MQSCEAPLRSQVELDCQMIAFGLTIEYHLTLTLYAVHLSVQPRSWIWFRWENSESTPHAIAKLRRHQSLPATGTLRHTVAKPRFVQPNGGISAWIPGLRLSERFRKLTRKNNADLRQLKENILDLDHTNQILREKKNIFNHYAAMAWKLEECW